MNAPSISTAIRAAVGQVAPEVADELDVIDREADLFDELDLDSMDRLAVMEALAASTGVDIPEAAYGRLTSLAAIESHLSDT